MGMIINIDAALANRTDYNLLREPINDMLKNRQEAWEQQNPIDLLFKRGTLNKFQETYTDSIGFAHAFAETNDYGVAPIFNTYEGFSKTYTSRTFQGGFIITQQVLEDEAYNSIKNTASRFITRWHGDQVEYAMKAISSGFGKEIAFGDAVNGGISRLKLTSSDTTDGDPLTSNKNPLFCKAHKTVKTREASALSQSNVFAVLDDNGAYGIELGGDDPGQIAKLADVINQVITIMENYKDDNGKYAGVKGAKTIVAPNDARLKAALETALATDMFPGYGINGAYKRATLETTPYLCDVAPCYANDKGIGFFIVDKTYNSENQGPEFTQRIAFTLNVVEKKNPYGISYDARERFDINVSSWRGIAYVYISNDVTPDFTVNGDISDFTVIMPTSTIVKPVNIVPAKSTTPQILSMTAITDEGLFSSVSPTVLHVEESDISAILVQLNQVVTLGTSPAVQSLSGSTWSSYGTLTVDANDATKVLITPTTAAVTASTISLRIAADSLINTAGVGNVLTPITMVVYATT